ncbi:DUF1254 domain-containing protein, partial [Novosphingobium sp. AP12]|uniref:DUF1254 domain-containing protein n=1 Tax=Novosphingobium sp. AP12 TaxID=1144305 RepID=UPI0002721F8B
MALGDASRPRGGFTTVETRIGDLSFTHDLPDGYPAPRTLEKLFDERDFQRACQTYVWSLPLVGFAQWQYGARKTLGAANGQIVSYLSYVDKLGILTPNATTPYYVAFVDLSESGPMVLELPAGGIRGGLVNVWQEKMEGCEPGGRYLLLGPGQEPGADAAGLEVRQLSSLNFMLGVRITVTNPAEAEAVLAALRMYPLKQRGDPPPTTILAAADRPWSGTQPRGLAYWERLPPPP